MTPGDGGASVTRMGAGGATAAGVAGLAGCAALGEAGGAAGDSARGGAAGLAQAASRAASSSARAPRLAMDARWRTVGEHVGELLANGLVHVGTGLRYRREAVLPRVRPARVDERLRVGVAALAVRRDDRIQR